MATPGGNAEGPGSRRTALGRTVLADLQQGDLHRSMWRDLKDLYDFYLDDEERARLRSMSRLKRWFKTVQWLLARLVLSLSPARRLLLLASSLFFADGLVRDHLGNSAMGFLLLLLVLAFELRDKLLARDELEVGRAVQLSLLPADNPQLPGWEIWLYTMPANDVGGDLLDYLMVEKDRLGLVLGDVAGKGLGAALLMAKLQATLRAFATEASSLCDLGERSNRIFCRDGLANRFATLVYLQVRPGDGHVALLNAGHMPPLHVTASGVHTLPPVALPLGIKPDAVYQEQRFDLAPGDLMVVYSDGLSEATNASGAMFGDDRVLELAANLRGLSATEAGERVMAAVKAFVGETRPHDDLSLALLRRSPLA